MGKIVQILKDNIRIFVSDLTDVVQKAVDVHQTYPLSTTILGTSIVSFAPLVMMQHTDKISAIVKSNGPSNIIIVDARLNGHIRALIGNTKIETEQDNLDINKIPLNIGIGNEGKLRIFRYEKGREYQGETELVKGDIVSDLTNYFDKSDQIYSAVVSNVSLAKGIGRTPNVTQATSVIFQLLPSHSEADIKFIENFIKDNSLSKTPIKEYISKLKGKIINSQDFVWECECNEEKFKKVTDLIPENERKAILAKEGKIETQCNYCLKKYTFLE